MAGAERGLEALLVEYRRQQGHCLIEIPKPKADSRSRIES